MGLQVFFNAGDDINGGNIFGVNWKAQTFTTVAAFTITHVKLKLLKGAGTGNITCNIKAVDGSRKPTGAALATVTVSFAAFLADPGQFETFTFGTPYALSASTEYAIELSAPSGDGSNYVGWRADNAGGYGGGLIEASGDSGATWSTGTSDDFMFETYNIVSSASSSISSSPSSSPSFSASPSSSPSSSPSLSPSPSTSVSSSPSASASPSASVSTSISSSVSPSSSVSSSRSSSISSSPSSSISSSPSSSISSSLSLSPSPSPSPALWTPRTKPTTTWTRTRP